MLHTPMQTMYKPVLMMITASATISEKGLAADHPAVVMTLTAAVVAVVYWLMRLIDKLMVQKGVSDDPVLKVLEQIRENTGHTRLDIKEMRKEMDIPHPYTPGFRAFAQHLREDIVKLQRSEEEVLVALNKHTHAIERLDGDVCKLRERSEQ